MNVMILLPDLGVNVACWVVLAVTFAVVVVASVVTSFVAVASAVVVSLAAETLGPFADVVVNLLSEVVTLVAK